MKSLFLTLMLAQVATSFAAAQTTSRTLVAFFSRADENYSVGVIEKGNTQIVAEMIGEITGGTLFHIETAKPYPKVYSECTDVARREQAEKARPALKGVLPNIDDYDVIYLGYPIWWGDLPMAVYTFIEAAKWQGKTVIPFCTHEGSGSAGTDRTLGRMCNGATVKKVLAIRGSVAQNSRAQARREIEAWIKNN